MDSLFQKWTEGHKKRTTAGRRGRLHGTRKILEGGSSWHHTFSIFSLHIQKVVLVHSAWISLAGRQEEYFKTKRVKEFRTLETDRELSHQ